MNDSPRQAHRSPPIRDPEVRALRVCARALEKFDADTQARILEWLTRKYIHDRRST